MNQEIFSLQGTAVDFAIRKLIDCWPLDYVIFRLACWIPIRKRTIKPTERALYGKEEAKATAPAQESREAKKRRLTKESISHQENEFASRSVTVAPFRMISKPKKRKNEKIESSSATGSYRRLTPATAQHLAALRNPYRQPLVSSRLSNSQVISRSRSISPPESGTNYPLSPVTTWPQDGDNDGYDSGEFEDHRAQSEQDDDEGEGNLDEEREPLFLDAADYSDIDENSAAGALEDEEPQQQENSLQPVRKAQKTMGTRRRPKASDYESAEKTLIAKAIELYRVQVTCKDGFPDSLSRLTWAKECWVQACHEYDINIDPDDGIVKLITIRDSHLRGEIKTAAKTIVDIAYGFETSRKDWIIKENRELAYSLKTSLAFTYRRPEEKKGLYQHRILQKIVNMVWFKNITDEGVRYSEYNPFPLHGLALVLTAVECAIDEWITGSFVKREFTADSYRSVYESHVNGLMTFQKKASTQNILGLILEVLTDNARTNAGATEHEQSGQSQFDESVFDEEIRQFEARGGVLPDREVVEGRDGA